LPGLRTKTDEYERTFAAMRFHDVVTDPQGQHVILKRASGALLLLALLAGCSGRDYETVPVSGRVTLDGEPLTNVGLMFVPLAKDEDHPNIGPGSLGRTGDDGRFVLETVRGENGAVPTEHVVRISLATESDTTGSKDDFTPEGNIEARPERSGPKLPANASDGTLHFVVPREGTDQANFHLKSE
jgi:hypothetical protein